MMSRVAGCPYYLFTPPLGGGWVGPARRLPCSGRGRAVRGGGRSGRWARAWGGRWLGGARARAASPQRRCPALNAPRLSASAQPGTAQLGSAQPGTARFGTAQPGHAAPAGPNPAPGLGRLKTPRADPDRLPPRDDIQQELLPLLQPGEAAAPEPPRPLLQARRPRPGLLRAE